MRWRRPLLLIALLLLAGAVMNVGVAWVLIGAPDSWTPAALGRSRITLVGGDPKQTALIGVTFRHGVLRRGFGWRDLHVWNPDSESPVQDWVARRVDGGWPLRSVTITTIDGAPGLQHTSSAPVPQWLPGEGWFQVCSSRIPLTPIPSGFALNTLFYAASLALPLSVFPIRRRLRARRGRCPRCGYDLAGLDGTPGADPAAPCPECGAAR